MTRRFRAHLRTHRALGTKERHCLRHRAAPLELQPSRRRARHLRSSPTRTRQGAARVERVRMYGFMQHLDWRCSRSFLVFIGRQTATALSQIPARRKSPGRFWGLHWRQSRACPGGGRDQSFDWKVTTSTSIARRCGSPGAALARGPRRCDTHALGDAGAAAPAVTADTANQVRLAHARCAANPL